MYSVQLQVTTVLLNRSQLSFFYKAKTFEIGFYA